MMDCDRCNRMAEMIEAYHDGELPRRKRILVEEHLRGCARCAAQLEALRRAGEGLRTALMERVAKVSFEGMWERVAGRLAESRRPSLRERLEVQVSEWLVARRPALGLALAGAVVAVLVVLPLTLRRGAGPAIELGPHNECLVDLVEARTGNVLVAQDPSDQTTVIWILDEAVGGEEAPAGPGPDVGSGRRRDGGGQGGKGTLPGTGEGAAPGGVGDQEI